MRGLQLYVVMLEAMPHAHARSSVTVAIPFMCVKTLCVSVKTGPHSTAALIGKRASRGGARLFAIPIALSSALFTYR